MSSAERQILENQVEMMWTLSFLISKVAPDLVGRNGEVDRVRSDLAQAAKKSRALLDQ